MPRLARLTPLVSAGLAALAMANAAPASADSCPNASLRVGPSANLADCRAYELVTPRTLSTYPYTGPGNFANAQNWYEFSSAPAAADGDSYVWQTAFAALPGLPGNGRNNQYLAERGAAGWATTTLFGPTGEQADVPQFSGFSADHRYAAILVVRSINSTRRRPLDLDLPTATYAFTTWVRQPDASFQLVGEGTIPASPDPDRYVNGFVDDVHARVDVLPSGGDHTIVETDLGIPFNQALQLTSDAPPSGTSAVYDRARDGLHLVSVLPGNITPTENATFQGASKDGRVVLFGTGPGLVPDHLWARVDNTTTFDLGDSESAGVSDDGSVADYVRGGSVYSIDTSTGDETLVAAATDAKPVLLTPDGSRIYFLSGDQLDGPSNGSPGGHNLYVSDGSQTQFIGELSDADVLRQICAREGCHNQGLGLGLTVARNREAALLHATSSPGGRYLAFDSDAQQTSYDNAGHREVYLFDASDGSLTCASCRPSGESPNADATLNSGQETGMDAIINNVSDDGQVVFESDDDVLPRDTNGVADVYRWKHGDVSLISTGSNSQPSHLSAVTPSGSDIFFVTAQRLVADGQDSGLRALYDARIDGGFPVAPEPQACTGDGCRTEPAPPPAVEKVGSTAVRLGNIQVDRTQPHRKQCKRFKSKAAKANAKARKLKRQARSAHSKKRAKGLRRKAHKQKQKAKRLQAKARACRKGSK